MKYSAFISYNSHDDKWAKWLQGKLESFHLPNVVRNEQSEEKKIDKKKLRVFRYMSDLNTATLTDGLTKELDEANYLIVICSPNSAKSEWVGREISHFIKTGKKDKIIPFIVDGEPYSKDKEKECLNPVLIEAFPDYDILGVNIKDYGEEPLFFRRRKTAVRVVSMIIDVPDAFNYLWNRYKYRWYKIVALRTILVIAVLAAIFFVWRQNQPFSCDVNVKEVTPLNTNLQPLTDAVVGIKLDNEVKKDTLKNKESKVTFTNIPGKYAGEKVHVTFDLYGFKKLDTVIALDKGKEITLNVSRDATFGQLGGVVLDENGQPVNGAKVSVMGLSTTTDGQGHFLINIPVSKQVVQPKVTVSKEGYKDEVVDNSDISTDWQVMIYKK